MAERTLGIILGASDFTGAGLSGGASFLNSASDFRSYLLSPSGLKLADGDVLYLFDSEDEASILLGHIAQFLQRRQVLAGDAAAGTLLVYYVGHGGFTPNGEDYFLAVRSTRKEIPWASGIRMHDLGHVVKEFARFQRRYFILDSCFSGQAYKILQSAPVELAALKTQASLPTKGTCVLCSSGPKQPSLAPENLQHTMFSEAFLQVLKAGEPFRGPALTLREVRSMVEGELRRRWDSDLVRPEIHSPDQSEGDISDFPIFPNPGHKPGAERKPLSVMFSNIQNATSLAERLSPDELADTLNEYFNAMSDTLFRNLGTLDKYIGHAIMAFWGAPTPQDDHPYRACSCALEMLARQQQLNRKWAAQNRPELSTCLGLSSGPVTVGQIGSENRLTLTVMGDHVNLASRLESLNREYGTNILVSDATYIAAKNTDLVFRELDLIRAKGKLQPISIYELICHGAEVTPDSEARLDRFATGRGQYRLRNWADAQSVFQSVLDQWPNDGPSRVYWKRCQEYLLEDPGPKWDGVFTAKYK